MLLGDVGHAGAVIPLMVFPRSNFGARVNRVRLYTDQDVDPSSEDYWTVFLGALSDLGEFSGRASLQLSGQGFRSIGVVWNLSPVVGFKAGEVAALRCVPTGQPRPLYGLRALVEVNHAR